MKVGDKECRAIILVQKGGTVDFLLGTDLLTQLGFCVLKTSNEEGQMIDLLQEDVWKGKSLTTNMKIPDAVPVTATDKSSTGKVGASEQLSGKEDILSCLEKDRGENVNSLKLSSSTEGSQDKTAEQGKSGSNTEVRLLRAVRLPGRHGKIVTGSTVKTLESKELLLYPNLKNLDDNRVIVTEALVKVDQQNKVKVLVENHETFPVFLEAGTTLGFLQPMQVVNPNKLPKALHLEADTLDGAQSKTTDPEKLHRAQELMDQLDIEWKNTSDEKAAGLKSVLEEFTLDPMKAGRRAGRQAGGRAGG